MQGINLANIIKDLSVNPQTGQPVINETVDKIKEHIGQKLEETTELLEQLATLDAECKKSLAHRVLAGKNGAHDALITLLEETLSAESPNESVLKSP